MSLVLGTTNGFWQVHEGITDPIGLQGGVVTHVADRHGTILAAVPRDGLYEVSNGDRCPRGPA